MDDFSKTLHRFTLQAIPVLIKSIFPSMYRSPFQYFLLKMCFFLTRIITPWAQINKTLDINKYLMCKLFLYEWEKMKVSCPLV